MKKKFSKILGIGLTLALLTSLLLTASPVSALTQPSVTLDDDVISRTAEYTIEFVIDEALDEGDEIIIEFDADIDITDISDGVDADVTIAASTGFGSDAFAATQAGSATDEQELTITIPDLADDTIGRIARVTVVVSGIINPDAAGDYYLTVETTEEDAVTSGAITIELPDISDLPGIVKVENATGTLMLQTTGGRAIANAISAAGEGYTIKIGPGTYDEDPDTADADVTFMATGTAAETIIVGDWDIDEDDITLDGLTLDGDITVTADDFTLKNSVVDDGGTLNLTRGATDATVEDTTFNVEDDIGVEVDADDTVITGSTFNVEEDGVGVSVEDGGTDTAVEDSTFTGSSGVGINVEHDDSVLSVEDSTFDGLEIALDIDAGAVSVKFNSILNSEDVGVDAEVAVDATFNWWGTTVADDIDDMVEGNVEYEPFLTDAVEAVLSASEVAANATSLDARDTVGVYVVDTTNTAAVILVVKYTANPQEAVANAVAFFDVYVGTPTNATDDVSLRFYVGDENSELYIWSADVQRWVEAEDYGFSTFGGYIYVTVDADVLGRTPFAVVTPPAVAATLAAPAIISPEGGERDVPLTPAFSWTQIAAADAYYFELADNANFVIPLMPLTGDVGRLIVTAYVYVPGLDYSTAYYWRVKAVSGTTEAGDLVESNWVSYVFITMDEPVEPTPPIVVEEAPTLPDITIVQPDIVVPLPAVTPITPAWIYVIIGVGAVLVIALLVLIVRTRRVA